VESWLCKGCEGNKATVEVYADAYEIELLLDGRRLGKKKAKDYKALFNTRYAVGVLTAIAYDRNGQEMSRSSLKPADQDTRISVLPEKETVKPSEVVYVDVLITGQMASSRAMQTHGSQ
jgi:hypothetical protein